VFVGGVEPLGAGAVWRAFVFGWPVVEEGDSGGIDGDLGAVLGEELVGVVEECVG
jgi:hypothetical protein